MINFNKGNAGNERRRWFRDVNAVVVARAGNIARSTKVGGNGEVKTETVEAENSLYISQLEQIGHVLETVAKNRPDVRVSVFVLPSVYNALSRLRRTIEDTEEGNDIIESYLEGKTSGSYSQEEKEAWEKIHNSLQALGSVQFHQSPNLETKERMLERNNKAIADPKTPARKVEQFEQQNIILNMIEQAWDALPENQEPEIHIDF